MVDKVTSKEEQVENPSLSQAEANELPEDDTSEQVSNVLNKQQSLEELQALKREFEKARRTGQGGDAMRTIDIMAEVAMNAGLATKEVFEIIGFKANVADIIAKMANNEASLADLVEVWDE